MRCLSILRVRDGISRRIEMFFEAAYISITRATSWRVERILHRTSFGVKVPRWICALSSVSLALLSIITEENLIISRCLRRTWFRSSLSSKSVKFIQVLRGVRISWLTFAEYIVVSRSLVSRSCSYCMYVISYRNKSVDSSPLK